MQAFNDTFLSHAYELKKLFLKLLLVFLFVKRLLTWKHKVKLELLKKRSNFRSGRLKLLLGLVKTKTVGFGFLFIWLVFLKQKYKLMILDAYIFACLIWDVFKTTFSDTKGLAHFF